MPGCAAQRRDSPPSLDGRHVLLVAISLLSGFSSAKRASADDYRDRVARANAIALGLSENGSNRAAFVAQFFRLLGGAEPPPTWRPGENFALPPGTDLLPPDTSILSHPLFQANAADAIKDLVGGDTRSDFFGGEPDHDFPDAVAIGTSERWCCSGVSIGQKAVLSTAHCLRLGCKPTRVFLGTSTDGAGRILQVKKIVAHSDSQDHDLMIIILQDSVDAPRIRALTDASDLTRMRAKEVHVVGFGPTGLYRGTDFGTRRYVDMIVASPDCSDEAARIKGCMSGHELLAGIDDKKRRGCRGDSGSPFYVGGSDNGKIGGVLSRGTLLSGNCGDGAIFVRVPEHKEWIDSVLDEHGAR